MQPRNGTRGGLWQAARARRRPARRRPLTGQKAVRAQNHRMMRFLLPAAFAVALMTGSGVSTQTVGAPDNASPDLTPAGRYDKSGWSDGRVPLMISLAVVLLSALSASAEAADYHQIGLGGVSSCGSWTEARSNNQATPSAYGQWVVGFLSGIGYEGAPQFGADPLLGMDADGVWAWIDNYCRDHPIDTIAAATKEFNSIHPH
jgi:hypothetical protein